LNVVFFGVVGLFAIVNLGVGETVADGKGLRFFVFCDLSVGLLLLTTLVVAEFTMKYIRGCVTPELRILDGFFTGVVGSPVAVSAVKCFIGDTITFKELIELIGTELFVSL
jgi:hypothetical protein